MICVYKSSVSMYLYYNIDSLCIYFNKLKL